MEVTRWTAFLPDGVHPQSLFEAWKQIWKVQHHFSKADYGLLRSLLRFANTQSEEHDVRLGTKLHRGLSRLTKIERFIICIFITRAVLDIEEEYTGHIPVFSFRDFRHFVSAFRVLHGRKEETLRKTNTCFLRMQYALIRLLFYFLDPRQTLEPPYICEVPWENSDMKANYYVAKGLGRPIRYTKDFRPLQPSKSIRLFRSESESFQ